MSDATVLLVILCTTVAALAGNLAVLLYVRRKHRAVHAHLEQVRRFVWDAANLVATSRPRSPLPMPGGWVASPDFLAELTRVIEARRPALVVELGSGLSTVVTALKLAELGCGRLVSIDHDERFAAATRHLLQANGVAGVAEIRVAPLVGRPDEEGQPLWYDERLMQDLSAIDLLVIDGPPEEVHPLVRKPALVFFRSRLAPGASVLLDDAARPGEQSILAHWRQRFPELSIEELPLEKGAARITVAQQA